MAQRLTDHGLRLLCRLAVLIGRRRAGRPARARAAGIETFSQLLRPAPFLLTQFRSLLTCPSVVEVRTPLSFAVLGILLSRPGWQHTPASAFAQNVLSASSFFFLPLSVRVLSSFASFSHSCLCPMNMAAYLCSSSSSSSSQARWKWAQTDTWPAAFSFLFA